MGSWRVNEYDIPSTSIGGLVLPASVDRVSVYFTNLGAAPCALSTRPPNGTINSGIALVPNVPFGLQWSLDGQVCRETFYTYVASGQVLHIIETLYYPSGDSENDGSPSS